MRDSDERRRLVEKLVREGIIKSANVIKALLRVPREVFVLPEYKRYAYQDTPLPIGFGQTISAPHMVGLMTEEAKANVGDRVLEIGTGSGYQAAVLAEIVAPSDEDPRKWGHVYTIERIKELAERAKENLKKAGYENRVTVIVGDGSLGYPPAAPYNVILVTAAAPDIPPPLIEQLKVGGRIIVPVGDRLLQWLLVAEKRSGDKLVKHEKIPCMFVPLIGAYGWSS